MNSKKICFSRIIGSISSKISLLTLLSFALLLSPMVAYGATVILEWDANTESDLAGYKVYYGTTSGNYSHTFDVGNTTRYPLTGLAEGVTYYFAVTAYDLDNYESDYSVELVHTIVATNNNPTTPFVPNSPSSGYTQTNYSVSTTASDPDGDALEFRFDWGNGSFSDWGTSSQSHAWASVGLFCIKAQAKDSNGALSGWSDCKSISITEVAYGATVILEWDANTESDLAGYKVYYGTTSGNYSHTFDVGNTTRYPLTGLAEGVTYYFAVTAYDLDNNESDYSVELVHTTDTPNNNPAIPSVPNGPSSVYTQTNYTFSTTASDPDGDPLQFRYDWDDASISGWGAASQSHSWPSAGNFCVKAQAKDSHGALSGWSGCKSITITVNPHTITASAGANGSISPSGNVTVDHGSNKTFTISAGTNYHVQDVLVNGVSVGAVTSYRFTNVTRNHTIQASFAINKHTITATAGANGGISPSGNITVNHGSSRTVTISAGTNYHVQDVLVNGVSVGAVTSYTFTNVTRNHTIQASFAIDTHNIAASAGKGGSISPAGSLTVNHGSNQAFTMTPAENYHIDAVLVDGTSVGAVATYQFNNASINHTIRVIFAGDKHPPVADAGADQAVYLTDTVHLDGSSSSDADGDSLIFNWSIVSKPSGSSATLTNTQAVKPTFDVDVAGTYTVQLTVNDGTANSLPDTVTISTENSAPVSDAGADQSVRVNNRVQLDGSGSSDVDGNSLTFTWFLVSKPGGSNATLSNTQVVKPTFDVDVAGTYAAHLTVNDGAVNSTPDTVTISTENSAPVSDAGADQSVRTNDTVQLDGSGSSDVDGDSLTFEWSLVSKPGGSSAILSDTTVVKPTFDVDVAGTYTVQLLVNDGTVISVPNTVTISTENSAPVANAGADQALRVNEAVQLDGSDSSDVDGDSLTFAWAIVSKPGGSSAVLSDTTVVKPAVDVDIAGTYTLQLIVNDGTLNSAPDTVTISTENSAPVGHAGADQAVLVNETVQLDGSGSSDVDGDTLTFEWSIVSKPGGSNATLSDTKAAKSDFDVDIAGTYTVQLIVNDGTANSAPHTVTISTENSAPVTNAGADQATLVNDTVQLDGSASSDVDGDSLTFEWSIVSKPGESSATLSDTTVVKPTFDVDIAGTYTLQLIVNDGAVNSAPDTVTISTENSAPVSRAGVDQAVLVNDSVQLDGSASSDADGDTLTFKWSFISIPAGSSAALSNAITVNPTFKVDVVGSYIVQLIVNDGTDNGTPDTVTIITENSAPVSNAGNDQTVEEGETVTLSGLNSTDPDDYIAGYTWQQTGGKSVTLSNSKGAEATFSAPNAVTDADTLIFRLTVKDAQGLQDIDDCIVTVTRIAVVDSDGDGGPDDQDAFRIDPEAYLDTDGDGEGNNADTDDDNDGMPDTWELVYGLDPLKDDAADDPDGDGDSNFDEYNLETDPNYNESNLAPDPPQLQNPGNYDKVGLTPLLETQTDGFYDPDINDVHSQTRWKIIRDEDQFIVFDVTTNSSLTALKVPKLILEEDTNYSWQVKFIDNQGAASEWSEAGYFTTEFLEQDSDGNGVLDLQEVDTTIDLDNDGIMDRDQEDIKCVATESGDFKIGISIREDENADSIVSIQSETPSDTDLLFSAKGGPNFLAFGLIHFKLLVKEPGDEVLVTIYLSKAAYDDGIWYKYDPVNDEWFDYSEFIDFSADRKTVHLRLTDGGFGDADGTKNGVIVDPLALRTATDHNSGSDFLAEDIANLAKNLDPSGACFISAADRQPLSFWREIWSRELLMVFTLMMLAYIGKEIFLRIRQYRRRGRRTSLMEGWRNT